MVDSRVRGNDGTAGFGGGTLHRFSDMERLDATGSNAPPANDYVDISVFDLQDYVIRLSPLHEKPPLPTPTPEVHWLGEFEVRIPERFPRGVFRSGVLAEADEGGGRNDG
jgi:hypothetical protein